MPLPLAVVAATSGTNGDGRGGGYEEAQGFNKAQGSRLCLLAASMLCIDAVMLHAVHHVHHQLSKLAAWQGNRLIVETRSD